jgi:hypothetical protein
VIKLLPQRENRAPSLLAVAGYNAGVMKAAQGVTFLATWFIAEQMEEQPLGGAGATLTEAMTAHADYWNQSQRTSFRELRAFRACFPGEEDPRRMAAELAKRAELRAQLKAEKKPTASTAAAAIGMLAVTP